MKVILIDWHRNWQWSWFLDCEHQYCDRNIDNNINYINGYLYFYQCFIIIVKIIAEITLPHMVMCIVIDAYH